MYIWGSFPDLTEWVWHVDVLGFKSNSTRGTENMFTALANSSVGYSVVSIHQG